MNENEEYIATAIRQWVGSGFYTHDEIDSMVDDIAEEDCDIEELKATIGPALRAKLRAERGWPAVTDCDRLDAVFNQLEEAGICALSNAGYTMSDGFTEVAEARAMAPTGYYRGFCFYHGQEVERAVDGEGLMLAFGDLEDNPAATLEIGQEVAAALRGAGFEVEWDGSANTRINIPVFDWKRRTSSGAAAG